MNALIVYFSRAGENYVNGTIRDLPVGNTEVAARFLQKVTGAGLFRLEMKTPYAHSYRECVQQAKGDWQENARPEPAAWPEGDLSQYGVIYLAYPNYCGTMPMVLFTFLEQYDFTGKTIYPLCTNEGSGLGSFEGDIRLLCPGATVGAGLSVRGAEAGQSEELIRAWAERAEH